MRGLVEEIVDVIGGVLFKPFSMMITGILCVVDVTLGLFLNGVSFSGNAVSAVVNLIQGNKADSLKEFNTMLEKIFVGPDTIFSGDVHILNANIFASYSNGGLKEEGTEISETINSLSSTVGNVISPGSGLISNLRATIAKFYVLLRNICAIVMLAGLIFTGIRILLNSNVPTKKMQYLMLLQDWLIGLVLLIFSHIIMIGIFYVSDTLTEALKGFVTSLGGINFTLIIDLVTAIGFTVQVVYIIMLGYCIWLTIVFALAYFKRLMWVSVLTVFAPVFSVMYAFGAQTKQIYSKWLREYMMTVFVQPFHMIVYSVLVGIPLSIVTTKGAGIGTDLFSTIYALLCIGFIRPAEKWMRGMFGMDKGIANMASYDSGKQTFDAAKNAVEGIVKAIAMAAAAAATGGASAVAGAGGADIGGADLGGVDLGGADLSGTDIPSLDEGLGIGPEDTELVGESSTQLDAFSYSTGDDFMALDDYSYSPGDNYLAVSDNTDSFGLEDQEVLKDAIQETGNNQASEDSQGKAPTALPSQNAENSGTSENSPNNESAVLSASNVTIQTSNLDIQGLSGANLASNDIQNALAEGKEGEDEKAKITLDEKSFDFGEGQGEEKQKRGLFNSLRTFTGLVSGSKTVSDSIPDKLKDKIGDENVAKIKAFDNVGGFSEAFKGLNSVMDTMYVDGGAPQDWKNTAQRMDENKKKKDEAAIYNFTNNKQNKEYVSMKLMEEAKGKYKDPDRQQQYVDSNLESRLKSLAQTYAPMGVSNAKLAYEIKDEGKQLGLPPEQAFLNRGNFERFNANQQNTAVVNATYKIDSPTVSQAIPNAREYYNNGYRDVHHMMDAQHIKDTLKTTTDMAMKLENVLRNTGKVNYNGADKAVQAKIDEINKYYEKRLKGGK